MFSRSKGGVRVPQKRRHTRLVRGGLAVSVVVYLVVAAWIGHTHTLHDFQILRQVVNVAKRPPAHGDTYKFYDYGSVYHDMNFTCPVAWEWTENPLEADALWYNVLNNGASAGKSISLPESANPLKVFMSLESETYYPYILDIKSSGVIDVTVDYRIWKDDTESGIADVPAVYLQNPTDDATRMDFRTPPSLPKRDDAYVAVFISNCGSRNEREQYLTELMELMPVHSYGKCHHNKDEPDMDESLSKFEKKHSIAKEYYFLFAAENSNAPSYVTEKIYDALNAGVVPIYVGAPNIQRFVPDPSAVIEAKDYSPKELAVLLNRTARDPKEYAKYFEWKKKPFSKDFRRILCLASRTVQCRLAMSMQGLDMEQDCDESNIDRIFT